MNLQRDFADLCLLLLLRLEFIFAHRVDQVDLQLCDFLLNDVNLDVWKMNLDFAVNQYVKVVTYITLSEDDLALLSMPEL